MLRLILTFLCITPLWATWKCPINKCCVSYNSSIDDSDLFRKCEKVEFIHAEFLYWNVVQGASDFAVQMTRPPRNATNNLQAEGKYQNACFSWNPGFRVAVGYFNAPKYWNIQAQYTWLYSDGKDQAAPSSATLFLDGTFTQYLGGSIERAESKIQLHYNLADFFVERVFLPNPHLRLRTLAGLTASFFSEKWRVRYLEGLNTETIMNQWKFNGGGFRIGSSVDWFFGKDFYFTGLFTLGSLVGRYKNFSDINSSFDTSGADDVDIPFKETSYKDTRLVLHTQLYLGPSYQRSFRCYRYEIFAGYELNTWFNLVEVFRSTQNSASLSKETLINNGVLGMHGLTVRATLDF